MKYKLRDKVAQLIESRSAEQVLQDADDNTKKEELKDLDYKGKIRLAKEHMMKASLF